MFKRAQVASAILAALASQSLYAQDTSNTQPTEDTIEIIDVRGVKASLNSGARNESL